MDSHWISTDCMSSIRDLFKVFTYIPIHTHYVCHKLRGCIFVSIILHSFETKINLVYFEIQYH